MQKKPLLKRLKNDLVYYAIRGVIGFFRIIPRSLGLRVASLLGRIATIFARKEMNLAIKHLTIAFGDEKSEEEIRAIAKQLFPNILINFIDAVRITVMKSEDVLNICVSHGFEKIEEPLKRGKGIIALSSHSGCWELLGPFLVAMKVPTAAVSKQLYDPRLEQMLLDTRTYNNIINISRGRDTRDIIRVLKKGYLVGVLIDQDTKVKGVFVDFFGRSAHTATAPAILSLKYDAPIIPLMTYRDEQDRHHICFGDPLKIELSGDSEKDIEELTRLCSIETESFIRRHPEQWVWFHRRWKTKAPEDASKG
ncbi:lysophospholipid acyltransferase family protein [Candidatus Latescibacterota bacterium]